MDMRQLRYFVQIVESGSLSKASRQLFIAQPALSQQMARLEGEVGKPLLVRSVRGVVPTLNGDALYQHAKFMLRQLDEALIIARQEYSAVKGRVTLGLPPTTAHILGLPLLKHLKGKYPRITLNVVEALSAQLEDMARLGQLDLAVLIRQTGGSDLGLEALLEEDLYVILPAASKLVAPKRKSLKLAEVAKLPLVLPSSNPSNSLRRNIMLEFEHANLSVNLVAEVDSLLLLLRLIAEGEGLTIRTMSVTQVLHTPAYWRCLPISDAKLILTQYLYALPLDKLSASASIVQIELKEVIRQMSLRGDWPGARLVKSAPYSA